MRPYGKEGLGGSKSTRAKNIKKAQELAKSIEMKSPDAVRHGGVLDSKEAVAECLTQVLADGDSAELVTGLGHVARARGMAAIAKESGLGCESLDKALTPGANPRLYKVLRVAQALGVRLQATPI